MMGSIYKPKNSKNFWIKYHRNGGAFRENSAHPKRSKAVSLLRRREGDSERGGCSVMPLYAASRLRK